MVGYVDPGFGLTGMRDMKIRTSGFLFLSFVICYFLPRFHMEFVILFWTGLVCFTALYPEAHVHGAPVSHFLFSDLCD